MPRCVIIYGPPSSGKSQHANELREIYGCTSIVDEWVPGEAVGDNTLILTQWNVEAIPIEEALRK